MYFKAVALLTLSFLEASSARLNDNVADFEDVPTCGRKKKEFCNTGPFFDKMKGILVAAPVVEGFYVDEEETAAAQGAINALIFYFQKKCKNCVEEEAKDELCALKDPIYQGIFDWVSDTMKDTVATYCPPEDFVCGKKHHELCNGDLYDKMGVHLKNTPKNGGVAAPEALNALNGFFTATCKSCVDHSNAKALCDSRKPIVTGIINNDDREYEDPTAKFCGNLAGVEPTPPPPKYGGRQAKKQCFVNKTQYPGDRKDNPVFEGGGFIGTLTLDACEAQCDKRKDSKGRPCVAIEWVDGGRNLGPNEKRSCAVLWGCDYLQGWGGGSVFKKISAGVEPTPPPPKYGGRQAKKQCFVNKTQYPGDRKDNPVFEGGGFIGTLTLDACEAQCDKRKDSKGRPCVAIEWVDGGRNLGPNEKRSCAVLWGCDYLQGWGGGSVFKKISEATITLD